MSPVPEPICRECGEPLIPGAAVLREQLEEVRSQLQAARAEEERLRAQFDADCAALDVFRADMITQRDAANAEVAAHERLWREHLTALAAALRLEPKHAASTMVEQAGRLREALERIADPLAAMRAEAERTGTRLDGAAAQMLANDAWHLIGIARAALPPHGREEPKP